MTGLGRMAMRASIAVLRGHALQPTRVREQLVRECWEPVCVMLDRALGRHPRLVIHAVRWVLDETARVGARNATSSVQGTRLLARIGRAMETVYPDRISGGPPPVGGFNWDRVAAQLKDSW